MEDDDAASVANERKPPRACGDTESWVDVETGPVKKRTRAQLSAQVFGHMAQVVHRTAQDATAILRSEGLNPAQYQLLLTVDERPGCLQRDLVESRGVTAANVSMLVSKLESAGLLRREAVGASNRLWLTPTGEALVQRLRPDQDAFMAGRFMRLDDHELVQLAALLARVAGP